MLPGSAAILLMGLRCALAVDFCENWEVNMSQNTPALDYLAPNVSEMTQQRGGVGSDPLNSPKEAQDQMTRTVAQAAHSGVRGGAGTALVGADIRSASWVVSAGNLFHFVCLFGNGGVWGDRLSEPAEAVEDGCAEGAGRSR